MGVSRNNNRSSAYLAWVIQVEKTLHTFCKFLIVKQNLFSSSVHSKSRCLQITLHLKLQIAGVFDITMSINIQTLNVKPIPVKKLDVEYTRTLCYTKFTTECQILRFKTEMKFYNLICMHAD